MTFFRMYSGVPKFVKCEEGPSYEIACWQGGKGRQGLQLAWGVTFERVGPEGHLGPLLKICSFVQITPGSLVKFPCFLLSVVRGFVAQW